MRRCLLRGSRDFETTGEYRAFLGQVSKPPQRPQPGRRSDGFEETLVRCG